jgi:hypothetical protein
VDRDEDLYRHLIVSNFAEELVRHIRWILSLSIKFSSHIKIKDQTHVHLLKALEYLYHLHQSIVGRIYLFLL